MPIHGDLRGNHPGCGVAHPDHLYLSSRIPNGLPMLAFRRSIGLADLTDAN
jgi:hypothetical protein